MSKKLFEPNKWIKFEIEGYTFIGITIETIEGEKLVSAIDVGGNNDFLTWDYIEKNAVKLTKLCFNPSTNDKEIEKNKPSLIKKETNQNFNDIVFNDCSKEEAELLKHSLLFFKNKKLPEA